MIPVRILGLDPGLARMGWGAIEAAGNKLVHIAHGVLTTDPTAGLGPRLLSLHRTLSDVLAQIRPEAVAIEQAFVHKDPSAALKLGQARAVALLAAAHAGLEIAEYSPNRVKKCVVGAGHAGKAQVLAMVKHLLPSARIDSEDAADALALAIAHAHLTATRARLESALA